MQNEIPTDIIVRFLEGNCTEEEKRELIRWCNYSKENQQIFDEYKETWYLSAPIPSDFSTDKDKARADVFERINKYEEGQTGTLKNISWYVTRVAAVFIIGFVLYFVYHLNIDPQLKFEKVASTDSKVEKVLPDGSIVWLNKNSTLEFVENFDGENRLVKLNGEAFFDVKPNSEKPFLIESNYSNVKVVGTSFNYKTNDSLHTLIVKSGIVEFSNKEFGETIRLFKGEKGTFNILNNNLSKSQVSDKNYLSWKTGVLAFNNSSFEKIINQVSDYYSQNFIINSPELKSSKLTVTFDNQDLDDVLKILEITMNINFEKTADKIIIN